MLSSENQSAEPKNSPFEPFSHMHWDVNAFNGCCPLRYLGFLISRDLALDNNVFSQVITLVSLEFIPKGLAEHRKAEYWKGPKAKIDLSATSQSERLSLSLGVEHPLRHIWHPHSASQSPLLSECGPTAAKGQKGLFLRDRRKGVTSRLRPGDRR